MKDAEESIKDLNKCSIFCEMNKTELVSHFLLLQFISKAQHEDLE